VGKTEREGDTLWLEMRGEAGVIDERSRMCQISCVQVYCFHILIYTLTHTHKCAPLSAMSKLLLAGACVTFAGVLHMNVCVCV